MTVIKDYFEDELEVGRPAWARRARALERIEDEHDKGNPLALVYAVLFCAAHPEVSLPRWATVALALELKDKAKRPRKKGRHYDPFEEYGDALIDSIRYDAVNDYVSHLEFDPESVIKMDRYEAGRILLAGTIAGGSQQTIRRSYARHLHRMPDDVIRSTPWEWAKLLAPKLAPGLRYLVNPERTWGFCYPAGAVESLLKKRPQSPPL